MPDTEYVDLARQLFAGPTHIARQGFLIDFIGFWEPSDRRTDETGKVGIMNGLYVHRLRDIYSAHVSAGLPDGRYVAAVCEPYTAGRLWAAWAVLTGRAYAFEWPKAGDLEDIFKARAAGAAMRGAPIGKQAGTFQN